MSVDDPGSMETAEINLQFLNNLGLLGEKTIVLVANKSDLVRNRLIKSSQGKALAQKYQVKYIETSPGEEDYNLIFYVSIYINNAIQVS